MKWRTALEEGSFYQGDPELSWSGKLDGIGASPVKANGKLPNGYVHYQDDHLCADTEQDLKCSLKSNLLSFPHS